MKLTKEDIWKVYLVHSQKNDTSKDVFFDEFWSNYEYIVEQGKQLQVQNTSTTNQSQVLPYARVFEKYWQSKNKVVEIKQALKFPVSQTLIFVATVATIIMQSTPNESVTAGICLVSLVLSAMFGGIFLLAGNPGIFKTHQLEFLPDRFLYKDESGKQPHQIQVFYQDIEGVRVGQKHLEIVAQSQSMPQGSSSTINSKKNEVSIPLPTDDKTLHFIRLFLEDMITITNLE